MTLAIIIGRVSTEDQAEDGTGLPGQIEAGMEHLTRRGYVLDTSVGFASDGIAYVPGVFQEDYTGKVAIRPAITAALKAIEQRPIKAVIVHRTSRLGRRQGVQELLEAEFAARGVRVEYVTAQFDTSTPTGRAMRRISGVFDELDYENIIEQLRQGKYQRAKSGSIVGTRTPYGYRYVYERNENGKKITRLVIQDDQAEVVILIFYWYAYGDESGKPLSLWAITRKLAELGIPPRSDRRKPPYTGVWDEGTIRNILMNETYIGCWEYGKTISIPSPHNDKVKIVPSPEENRVRVEVPRIIESQVFQTVQVRLRENREKASRNRNRLYLFSGMLKCAGCNTAYSGTHGERGYRKLYYKCRGAGRQVDTCPMPRFYEYEIDGVVWPWIKEITTNFARVEAALSQQQIDETEQNAWFNGLIVNTDKLIAEKQTERDRVMALYKKGSLKPERWEVEDAICEREIASLQQSRAELVSKLIKPKYTPEYLASVKRCCARIAQGIDNFTLAEQREAYELLDLHICLAVEDGYKVVHGECILDAKRLEVSTTRSIEVSRS